MDYINITGFNLCKFTGFDIVTAVVRALIALYVYNVFEHRMASYL